MLNEMIDLRSDTVTKPTLAMREAMAAAEVGDDVYGEDPTINQLQDLAADMLGKEAGLFVPSGTMGNLAAILTHCGRGDEIILGNLAHTYLLEAGGIAALGGIHPNPVPNQLDGTINSEDILNAIRPNDPHYPKTRLIALENTHNRCRGATLTAEYCQSIRDIAEEHGLKMHLDGARIFNAAIALDTSASALADPFASVTFCLSKGLGAPVGSVISGSKTFISKAHRIRKQLGGGMRQAGVIAAAGIVALQQMIDRLREDHRRARQLAGQLVDLPGILLEGEPITNMVYINLADEIPIEGKQFRNSLKSLGVLIRSAGSRRYRLVTHYGIKDKDIGLTIEVFKNVLNRL